MVIVGLGNDLIAVGRIKNTFLRFGTRFLTRALHPHEINEFNRKYANSQEGIHSGNENNNDNDGSSSTSLACSSSSPTKVSPPLPHLLAAHQRPFEYLASLWAVKEAVYKAFGGVDRKRLNFPNIRLVHGPSGKPDVVLEGGTKELATEMGVTNVHVAITHDHCYVVVNVILEQR